MSRYTVPCDNAKDTSDIIFVGGMRWTKGFGSTKWRTGGNATWPLIKLRMNRDGVCLTPNGIGKFFPFIPIFNFKWSDIRRVETLYRGGLRIIPRSSRRPVIFWSFKSTQVLDAFERRGVSVDRQPRSIFDP